MYSKDRIPHIYKVLEQLKKQLNLLDDPNNFSERVEDIVAKLLEPGTNVSLNYQDSNDKLIISSTDTNLSVGNENQIPFVNSAGDNLEYSSSLEWNDTSLLIDGNIDISNKIILAPISSPSYTEGQLWYSADTTTLSFQNDRSNVTLNIGEETFLRVRNTSGTDINDGEVVYITGFSQGSGVPTVELAQADSEITANSVGVATETISDNGTGMITTYGLVRGVDTSSFNEGDRLFLSDTTPGVLTTTEPNSPNFSIRVGRVSRSHSSSGQILVGISDIREGIYTQGSIPFANSSGRLIDDNANLSWDGTDINVGGNVVWHSGDFTSSDISNWHTAYDRSPTGLSGSGNSTLTLTKQDSTTLTTNLAHSHDLSELNQNGANDGEVIKWNNSAGQWEPATDIDTHLNVSDNGTQIVANVDDINFSDNISVVDDNDGSVSINVPDDLTVMSNYTTDDLNEGNNNLYYTTERVDDRVANLLSSSDAITLNYNDSTDTLTIGESHSSLTNNPHNVTASQVGALVSVNNVSNAGGNINLVDNGNVTISPDSGNDQINISVPNDLTVMSNYTTDDLSEGNNNLYYTNERVDDRVNNLLSSSDAITLSYDDTNNTLVIGEDHSSLTNNPHNVTAAQVGAIASIDGVSNDGGDIDLINAGNVTITPNDSNDQISFSVPNDLTVMSNYDTDDLSEGNNNLYFTDERAQDAAWNIASGGTDVSVNYNDSNNTVTINLTGLSQFNTDDLSEGSNNLYFTDERVDDRVSSLIQDGTGLSWTYDDVNNTLTGNVSLSPFDTDNLSEGTNNLYFTDERAQDAISTALLDTSTISWTYDDQNDQISANVIDDSIGTSQLDLSMSPTWTGDHTFQNGIDVDGSRIINVGMPTQNDDAATKEYVDAIEQGLSVKDGVRLATTGNIDLTSSTDPNPIDGVTLNDGDRILLWQQTDASENGIYSATTATNPSTWVRSVDADDDNEVNTGMFTFVEDGNEYGSVSFILTTEDPITVGTTDLNFTIFTKAGEILAGTALAKNGNTLHVSGVTVNEIANSALTGIDSELVTGTAGSSGELPEWNSDGDLTGSGLDTSTVNDHLNSTSNPHNVTASQVGALVSVDGVSNDGGNIDLINNGNVTITSDDANNEIGFSVPNDLTVMSNYDTDDLNEGSTNLYFTNERVDDRVSNLLDTSDAITLNYDDANNTLTIGESHSSLTNNPHNVTANQVGALVSVDGVSNSGGDIDLVNAGNVTINSDNTNNQISLSVPNDLTVMSNYTTDDLSEGNNNLYFTDERVDDRVANLLNSSDAITLNYDDANNILTIGEGHSSLTNNPHNVTAEEVGAIASIDGVSNDGGNIDFVNGGNVTINPSDSNDQITFSVPNDLTVMSNYTTDDLNEGTNNLYFTDERAQDAVGGTLTNTNSVDLNYDNGNDQITANLTINTLTSLGSSPSSNDMFAIYDDSAGDHKEVSYAELEAGLTITESQITGANFSNWNTAYDDSVIGVSGNGNGTFTINRRNSTDVTTNLGHGHGSGDLPSDIAYTNVNETITGNWQFNNDVSTSGAGFVANNGSGEWFDAVVTDDSDSQIFRGEDSNNNMIGYIQAINLNGSGGGYLSLEGEWRHGGNQIWDTGDFTSTQISNWDTAYDDSVTGVSGSGNGTLTINRRNSTDVTTNLGHGHGSGDLPSSIAYEDESNTFTQDQTFQGNINLQNEANAYKIGGTDIIRANISNDGIAIGDNNADLSASNGQTVAIGNDAGNNSGFGYTAMGHNAGSDAGDNFMAFGKNAGTGAASDFVALGLSAGTNAGTGFFALGRDAGVNAGDQFVAIGEGSSYDVFYKATVNAASNLSNSIAIGFASAPQFDGHFVIHNQNLNIDPLLQGDISTGNVGIGLDINGDLSSYKLNVGGTIADPNGNSTEWNTAYAQRGSQIAGNALSWNSTNEVLDVVETSINTSNLNNDVGSDQQIMFNNSGSLGASSNFIWDYSNNRLGILSTNPESTLDVNGSVSFTTGVYTPGSSLSVTLGSIHHTVIGDTANADITFNLPSGVNGRQHIITKLSSSNTITIDSGTANGIVSESDGYAQTYILTDDGETIFIVAGQDGNNNLLWIVKERGSVNPSTILLGDLGNTSLSGSSSGNFLKYDGSNWINSNISSSDLPSHSHTLSDITDSGAAAAKGVTGTASNVATGSSGGSGFLAEWDSSNNIVGAGIPTSDLNISNWNTAYAERGSQVDGVGLLWNTTNDELDVNIVNETLLGSSVVGNDQILVSDVSAGDIIKKTTAQDIADLAPSTSPAGSSQEIQFNNSGSFGASSNLIYDYTNGYFGSGDQGGSPNSHIHAIGSFAKHFNPVANVVLDDTHSTVITEVNVQTIIELPDPAGCLGRIYTIINGGDSDEGNAGETIISNGNNGWLISGGQIVPLIDRYETVTVQAGRDAQGEFNWYIISCCSRTGDVSEEPPVVE